MSIIFEINKWVIKHALGYIYHSWSSLVDGDEGSSWALGQIQSVVFMK